MRWHTDTYMFRYDTCIHAGTCAGKLHKHIRVLEKQMCIAHKQAQVHLCMRTEVHTGILICIHMCLCTCAHTNMWHVYTYGPAGRFTYIHTCVHACVGTCTSTLIQQEPVSDNFYRIRTLPRLWPFQFPFNIAMDRECLVQKMNRSTAEKVTRF